MHWELKAGVRCIELEDGVVLFDPERMAYTDLNESGGELWNVMRTRSWSIEAATDFLVESYAMQRDQAQEVVVQFVDDLERAGVVRRVG